MAGNDDDLGAFLRERLEAQTDLPVFLHILTDKFPFDGENKREYSFANWKNEYLYAKRLVLVFQKRPKNGSVLVIGMSVHEYCRKADTVPSRSYIQYIDTTGLYEPRQHQSRLTRSLVTAYIHYCQQVQKCYSIHLMACAKPSFLFAGSEFNTSKGKLSTAKLVKWWFAVIEEAVVERGEQYNMVATVKVWSPGEDLIEDGRTADRIERRQAKSSGNVTWKYGPLFDHNSKITDVVGLFEDDPKLKHFTSFYEDLKNDSTKMDKVACKNFIETLALRPEFRSQCHATIFQIDIERNDDSVAVGTKRSTDNTKPTQLAAFAAKMLGNLTFEDEQKCIDASGKITSWLKFMGNKPIDIRIVASGTFESAHKPLPLEQSSAEREGEDIENALNVQGLIKKRRVQS
jgi:hypothetical protein